MTGTPAEAFPPSEYLRDELGGAELDRGRLGGGHGPACAHRGGDARQGDGDHHETARALSEALGTTPEVWLNLQAAYRLHQQRAAQGDGVGS